MRLVFYAAIGLFFLSLHAARAVEGCWSIADALARARCQNAVDEPVPDLGMADIGKMHETYDKNQARFFRDFRGKLFSGTLLMDEVRENPIFRGRYKVDFVQNRHRFMGDVSCQVEDKPTIDYITDLDKGDRVSVTGVVFDHSFGAVELQNCKFQKQ
jgi:hypothetical protein